MHPCGSHAIIGKKGGGKSFLATKLGTRIIAETPRILVTNLPLRHGETAAYMNEHWPTWSDDIHTRIEIIDDVKLLKRFWLYRGLGWCIPDVSKEDFNKGARLDYRTAYRWKETTDSVEHRAPIVDMTKRELENYVKSGEMEAKHISELPPVQYIIDEIQNIFPARGFMQTSQGCLFWLSQQRKLCDDLIWISQNSDLVDKEFRDLTDDWLYITNWGRKRKSIFRLPKVMTWAKYDQRPGPGISPMVQGTFKLDIAGIGQCYDTSAGVGIEGGLTADTKEGIGGVHWAWFLVALAIGGVLLLQTPKLFTKGFAMLLPGHRRPAQTTNAAPTITSNAPQTAIASLSPPPSIQPPAPTAPLKSNLNVNVTPPVKEIRLTGITTVGGIATAWFDDGTAVTHQDTGWQGFIRAGQRIVGVQIAGTNYLLHATPTLAAPVPRPLYGWRTP